MTRLRRRASVVLLALMVVGMGAGAGSAFAYGGCCEMAVAHADGDRESPCHSVAPTSCCEASAPGAFPSLPGAPWLTVAWEPRPPALSPLAGPVAADPSARARAALATTVLRL